MTDKDLNYTSDKRRKHLVILGAGKPHFGNAPSALIETSLGGNQLQWLLAATHALVEEATFIGGYKNKDVSKIFAELTLINNPEWETTGSFGSLLKAPLDKIGDMIVSYSDILFNHSVANSIENENADIVVAYDSLWLSRYTEHENADIENLEQINFASGKVVELGYQLSAKKGKSEFIGLAWFSKKATAYLSSLPLVKKQEMRNLSLSEGIEQLRCSGLIVEGIDVEGNWTQLRNANDIRKFVLRTKAETLNNLRGALKEVIVLDQINFSVSDWQLNNEHILLRIEKMFAGELLAVRSSASNEDGFKQSNAGAFCSKLNVKHGVILKDAINEVIASYEPAFEYDQVKRLILQD
jgi:glutamine kinase